MGLRTIFTLAPLQGSLSFGMDLFDVYPAISWMITVFGPLLQVRMPTQLSECHAHCYRQSVVSSASWQDEPCRGKATLRDGCKAARGSDCCAFRTLDLPSHMCSVRLVAQAPAVPTARHFPEAFSEPRRMTQSTQTSPRIAARRETPVRQAYYSNQFTPFFVFFAMFLLVVRNEKLPHFMRFNAMQSILLDICVMLSGLIIQYLPFELAFSWIGGLGARRCRCRAS